jgi:nicotinamidase-related amidase
VTDAHLPGIDGELDVWGEHAMEGSWGAEVVDGLKPLEGDYRILKRRYSPFYATGLDSLLRELGVDTLVLTGLVTNICIQHAAADAFFRGYGVVVPRDCVDAATQKAHEAALSYMEQMYGAEVTTSDEVVEKFLGGAG